MRLLVETDRLRTACGQGTGRSDPAPPGG